MRKLLSGPRVMALIWVAVMGCAATPTGAEPAPETFTDEDRETVIRAMQAELERSMDRLRISDYDPPYFLAYRVKEEESVELGGKYGAITSEQRQQRRFAYVESRVGDYDFDNFANIDAYSWRMGDFRADLQLPIDANEDALRGALWLLTDEAYKRALSDYLTKRGGAVYSAERDEEVPSFTREEPENYRSDPLPLNFDDERWRGLVRETTQRLREYDFLLDSEMNVSGRRQVRYLVNSEGTDVVEEFRIYSVSVQAVARAEDGMLLRNSRMFYALDADRLPDDEAIWSEVEQMVADLDALRTAPVLDPYTGPAILSPEASGVLFHEAVGHRLEGERQRDEYEGRTFAGQIGTRLLPAFLTVYDDPNLEEMAGVQLNGHYRYDDEGVRARRASLVESGVVTGFLMSRTPIEGFDRSTGHGRAQWVNMPRGRMANLVIEASEDAQVTREELREMLIEEARRQDRPYGLIIEDITGGSTNTLNFGYQAFKGIPTMIYKVDAQTGEETLVRGVEMVGTPLSSINKIVAASDEIGVFNGYCGAESGFVPVSAVAPALLTTEIELQRASQARERGPILPAPWVVEEPRELESQDPSQVQEGEIP